MKDMTNIIKSHSTSKNLVEWLSYLENLHVTEIDLGLTRIGVVAEKLDIDFSSSTVITVAGTNGKGTTCAFLENACIASAKTVAVYSSPHIEIFNERLRINKVDVADQPLIDAFNRIESVRGDTSLTYYEYTTLAAFLVLQQNLPDVIILEVGLGGRLDATNLIDADIAVITSVDLDHQSFLGDTREKIGFEKAGIFRKDQFAVVGDPLAPESVTAHANSLNTQCRYREKDFMVSSDEYGWIFQYKQLTINHLIDPHIPKDNVATALTVLAELDITLNTDKVNELIEQTKVAGRTELFKQVCDVMLDVGHNPHAARYLATTISAKKYTNVYAVFGMLSDKDIAAVISPLLSVVSHWFVGGLSVHRGANSEMLSSLISQQTSAFDSFDNVSQAFKMAMEKANKDDLVLVFGSFYTVAEIRRKLA